MMEKLGNFISEYSVRNKQDEDIPVYSVTNEHGFCTGYFSKDVSSKDRTTYKIVPYGCFAYNPSRINVGSVDWQHVEDRVIVSPLYVVFRVNEELDQRYLLHYLKSDMTLALIKAKASGSVRDNLKLSDLQEFPIVVHNIEKQRRVADNIDKVDQLISLYQQRLVVLDELVKSRFIELFGDLMTNEKKWSQQKISSVCIEVVDCINKTAPVVEEKTNYKMIRTTNVRNGSVNIVDVKYVTKESFEKWTSRSVPQDRDVLLTREAPMGQVGILFGAKNDIFLGQRLVSYRCDETVMNPVFLLYQMMSSHFQNQIEKCGKGSTVKHIPVPDCTEFRIFVPPIDKQRTFEDFVTQVDKSKFVVQQSLRELETLKKSLMQKYFG